jgi:hypothetical protein
VAFFVLSRADNRISLPATRGLCGNFNTFIHHLKCQTAASYVCNEGFILQDDCTEDVLFRRFPLSKAAMHHIKGNKFYTQFFRTDGKCELFSVTDCRENLLRKSDNSIVP